MKEDFYTGCVHVSGSLSAHFLHCSDMDLYHGHSEQLSHHLHALHRQWIQKHLSPVISSNKHWEIVRLKRKKKKRSTENAEIFKIGRQEQKRTNWTVLLGDTEEMLEVNVFTQLSCRTVPDQQPMQYTLTLCSFTQPRGYWHLNHYCIKVIFCGCTLLDSVFF